MKREAENRHLYLLVLMIIFTQGALIYLIFSKLNMGFLKAVAFELSMILIAVFLLLEFIISRDKIKLKTAEMVLYIYLLMKIFVLVFINNNGLTVKMFFYAVKENILMFIIIKYCFLYYKEILNNRKIISKVLITFVIGNILTIIISYIVGYQKITQFFVGREFYGYDLKSGLKLTQIGFLYRFPGLVGDANSIGMFGFFSYVILERTKYAKYKVFSFILTVITAVRNPVLGLCVYIVGTKIFQNRIKVSSVKYILILFTILALPIITIVKNSKIFLTITASKSLGERGELWNIVFRDINRNNVLEHLLGAKFGFLGMAAKSIENIQVIYTFMDNAWLYLFLSVGVIGIVLIIWYFANILIENFSPELIALFLAIGCMMLVINVFQSEIFLCLFPVAMVLICFDKKNEEE